MLIKATNAPSPHAESARLLIEKLHAWRDEFPRFTIDGLGDGRSQTAGLVPEKFLESASSGIQNNPRIEQLGGADATTLRDAYAYALALDPVVAELKALTRFVEHSIRVQRNAAGILALDLYSSAKRIAKRRDGADLRPFVEDMRVKLGKRRSRKADPETGVAPVTDPSKPPVKP